MEKLEIFTGKIKESLFTESEIVTSKLPELGVLNVNLSQAGNYIQHDYELIPVAPCTLNKLQIMDGIQQLQANDQNVVYI